MNDKANKLAPVISQFLPSFAQGMWFHYPLAPIFPHSGNRTAKAPDRNLKRLKDLQGHRSVTTTMEYIEMDLELAGGRSNS